MIVKDDITLLREVLGFYEKLKPEEESILLAGITKSRFKKGTLMHSGTKECSGLFIVKSGTIRVFISSNSGKELTLYHLLDRDICLFSASCIFHNIQFDLHVEVEKEAEVYVIDSHVIQKLMNQNPFVSSYINEIMSSRFSEVMWMFEQTLFLDFETRLAKFLYEQTLLEDSNQISLTHEEISNHLGTAREVVSRMLKHFEKQKILRLDRGLITILNLKELLKRYDKDA